MAYTVIVLLIRWNVVLHLVGFLNQGPIIIEVKFTPINCLLRNGLLAHQFLVLDRASQDLNLPFAIQQKTNDELVILLVKNWSLEAFLLVRVDLHGIQHNLFGLRLIILELIQYFLLHSALILQLMLKQL